MKGCRYSGICTDSHCEADQVSRSNLIMRSLRDLGPRNNRKRMSRLTIIPLCIIISLILSTGCSVGENTKQSKKMAEENITSKKGDISVGKRVYEKYCHYCHGMEGRGDGAIAIGLSPLPVDFVNDVDRMKKSDKALFESISRGVHRKIGGEAIAMPQWDLILTKDEIWGVLAYVRYLSEKGRMENPEDY